MQHLAQPHRKCSSCSLRSSRSCVRPAVLGRVRAVVSREQQRSCTYCGSIRQKRSSLPGESRIASEYDGPPLVSAAHRACTFSFCSRKSPSEPQSRSEKTPPSMRQTSRWREFSQHLLLDENFSRPNQGVVSDLRIQRSQNCAIVDQWQEFSSRSGEAWNLVFSKSLRYAVFGQPLQFVGNETLAALWVSRLQLNGQGLSAVHHLLSNRFVGSCIELGEWRAEGRLKGKSRPQGRHVPATFVARHVSTGLIPKQIGNLALTEPGSFSISSQIIRKFVRRHVASEDALRP